MTLNYFFEEQVSRTPDAIAIVYDAEAISYAELNSRANKLACYLKAKGVRQQSLVPLCMDKSIQMIVSALAILKAGGAYVPIDPEFPMDRINYIICDLNPEVFIINKKNGQYINDNLVIINIDEDWQTINKEKQTNLNAYCSHHSLANVIYTSGSTGEPKGVMIDHENIVSLVKADPYPNTFVNDTLLSTGSISFDATTFEYWSMLLNGGKLILLPKNKLLDSEYLKLEIVRQNVTIMWFTSSWFNQLVDLDIGIFDRLETIFVGGEKLSETHIYKLKEAYAELNIINGYGPTENTTFSLLYNIKLNENLIPIGKPFKNRKAYILDKGLQLCPPGIIGQIFVGGLGLSRGYLNRPELTAEKFIINPFSKELNERFYATGDMGRWRKDGNIEFLGRMDDQVKIHGYRIELGEIENVLMKSGLIERSVVLVINDNKAHKILVAFVVPKHKLELDSLFSFLRKKLPKFMIPASIVELDNFPLTVNGKIDKDSLVRFYSDQNESKFLEPSITEEIIIASIWQKVLNIDKISRHDNFFQIGGDSIKIISVVSDLRKAFKKHISITDVYEADTLEKLASLIREMPLAPVILSQ